VIEIGKMLARCAKDRKILPKFMIYDLQEVPAPSALTREYVVSKIQEIYKKIDKTLDKLN